MMCQWTSFFFIPLLVQEPRIDSDSAIYACETTVPINPNRALINSAFRLETKMLTLTCINNTFIQLMHY